MKHSLAVEFLFFAILIIQVITHLQRSEEAETIPYLQKYVLKLFDSSPSKFDFILQVQALFCSDQPICGSHGNRSYDDIINRLPSLEARDVTVEAREISKLIGVCCLPCSCDDSCIEDDRCCLSKLAMDLETTGSLMEPAVKSECIAATSKAYFSHNLPLTYPYHPMVSKCFPKEGFHATNEYNITVVRCEQPAKEHNVIEEMIPVTSPASGRTYWNKNCAICNYDSEDIVSWSARAYMQRPFFFFVEKSFVVGTETFESFFENIVNAGELIYTKPKAVEYIPCISRPMVSACGNQSLLRDNPKERFMREACSNFSAAVLERNEVRLITYKNIFCLICNDRSIIPTQEENTIECLFMDVFKGKDPIMTGVLNYRGDGSKAVNNDEAGKHCSCQSIYDRNKNICVPLFCPPGESFESCECVPFAFNVTGVPVALKLVIKEVNKHQLPTAAKVIENMAFALAKEITNFCKGLQVAIVAAFMDQSRMDECLWFVAEANTVQGLDTKESVKKLADHLEGPSFLKLAFANNIYKISLTNKISLWKGLNDKIAAKDLLNNVTLMSVYQNTEILNDLNDGFRFFQELSPILFCKQVQLSESQYTEKDDIVTITASPTEFETVNFYRVTGNRIRICVEDFLKTFPSKMARHAWSLGLFAGLLLCHTFDII